jgi:hypothetical protein
MVKSKRKPLAPPTSESQTSESESSPSQRLHEEFRSLLSLLCLVTEDRQRHSTLSSSHYEKHTGLALEKSEGMARSLSNAVATLLVRDTEIVAVASSEFKSESDTMQFAALANPDEKDKYNFSGDEHILVPLGRSCWSSIRDKGLSISTDTLTK